VAAEDVVDLNPLEVVDVVVGVDVVLGVVQTSHSPPVNGRCMLMTAMRLLQRKSLGKLELDDKCDLSGLSTIDFPVPLLCYRSSGSCSLVD